MHNPTKREASEQNRSLPGNPEAELSNEIYEVHTFLTEAEDSGVRLDLLLNRRFKQRSRSVWQNRILSGNVLVNESLCKPSRKIKQGEKIAFRFQNRKEPEINRNFRIIYDDDDLLVIDKPPNLPVHPSGIYFKNTLLYLLQEHFGNGFVAHFAHRLDRETSGLLILGKSRESAAFLSHSFQADEVHKEYVVMVEGRPPDYLDARGILIADDISSVRKKRKFLEANKKNRLQIYEEMQSNHDARDCRTEFRIMGTANGITILSAILHTGRLHQIRATLCGLGFPVVGDRLYGVDDSLYLKFIQNRETDEDRKRLRMNRTALHCRLLELNHPGNKKRIRFESPIPDDMLALQNFK